MYGQNPDKKTEGFGKKEHCFLNVLVIGEICALSDVLCVALQNYVNEKIFFGLNAVFYLSYIVLLYILLQHTKKICAGEKYYSGIGNQIIALIPMIAVIILTIASVDKEGKVTYILFAVMDITEEIADRNDIRTPMNAIIGYIQLMKKDIQNQEKVLGYLEKQEQAGEFLLALINNVLDMSKIESGNAELDEEYSYMGNLAEEIIGVFNILAKRKHLTLKHLVHVEHPHILCDKTKVSEILSNLISNAVKYTADGGEVTVTTRELPSDKKGYILIQTVIEDTGIGMSKEFLPHIFDTFSRARVECERLSEHSTHSDRVTNIGYGFFWGASPCLRQIKV